MADIHSVHHTFLTTKIETSPVVFVVFLGRNYLMRLHTYTTSPSPTREDLRSINNPSPKKHSIFSPLHARVMKLMMKRYLIGIITLVLITFSTLLRSAACRSFTRRETTCLQGISLCVQQEKK